MSRLYQIVRNLFIRLEAFLSVFLGNVFNFLGRVFGFLGRLFGFSKAEFFLESDRAQGIKRNIPQPESESDSSQASKTPESNRRRPNTAKMDYYLNMAKEIKNN